MGSLSDYTENKWLDHILKVAVFTQPTNLYIGLSTADPLDDGSGLAEPSGGSYARVLCNDWDAAANRAIINTALIEFAQATGNWGNITHFIVADALSGVNIIAHGSLTSNKNVTTGGTFSIEAGGCIISVKTGTFSNYIANKMLDHTFKNTAYTPATHLHVGLATVALSDALSGSTVSEPPANYARIQHDVWHAASGGVSTNDGVITFDEASTIWGTIANGFIADALIEGNVLLYGALTASHAYVVGDQPQFADAVLSISLD